MARVRTRLLQTSVTLNARSVSTRLNVSVTAISRGFDEWTVGTVPPTPPPVGNFLLYEDGSSVFYDDATNVSYE